MQIIRIIFNKIKIKYANVFKFDLIHLHTFIYKYIFVIVYRWIKSNFWPNDFYQKLMREKHTRFSPRFYPQIAIYNQLYLCSYSYHSLPTGIITKCVLSSVEYNYNIFG